MAHVRTGFGEDLLGTDPADCGDDVKHLDLRLIVITQTALDHHVGFLNLSGLLANDSHHMGEKFPLRRCNGMIKRTGYHLKLFMIISRNP